MFLLVCVLATAQIPSTLIVQSAQDVCPARLTRVKKTPEGSEILGMGVYW